MWKRGALQLNPGMVSRPMVRITSFFMAALLLLCYSGPAVDSKGGDIAVVVRPELPVDNLTFNEVRKLLLGDRQFWVPGLKVTLLMRAPVAHEREVILRTVYRMTEVEFRRYWMEKVFRAEAPGDPQIVYSNETATELVRALPGAVAFVDAAQVPKGLKVLRIDGRLPGDKGYPLH